MADDVIKFTVQKIFLPAMKLFLQKQAVITSTMTKHIYNVFNLSFTLLTRNKTTNTFIDLIFFFFVPKRRWDSCPLQVLVNGAGRYSCFTYYQFAVHMWCIFFHTHFNGLEQGYSIIFIWGPDYQTENLKGAKGVGAIPISFWGEL